MTQSSPEANAAYVRGLCVELCGRPHSAGRTRCNECHDGQDVVLIEPSKREVTA